METHLQDGRGLTIAPITDPAAFIRANTRLRGVPLVPEISLYLADEAVPLWQKTEDELQADGLPPPFWAFAWAGGQALARYVLDHPATVRGKRVLDLASGSGLVGIAAMQGGAADVMAADIDPFARVAIGLNAEANAVTLHLRDDNLLQNDVSASFDIVLAGDIFYERETAEKAFTFLTTQQARGATVLIGDPGRSYLPKHRLAELQAYQVPVTRDLEDMEIKRTSVWTLR